MHSLFVVLMRINSLMCTVGHPPKDDDKIADVTNKPLWGSQRAAAGYHFFRAVPSKHQWRVHFLEVTHGLKSDSAEKPGPFLSFQHLRIEVALARSTSMTPTREPLESSEQSSGDPLKLDRPRVRWLSAGRPRVALQPETRRSSAPGEQLER